MADFDRDAQQDNSDCWFLKPVDKFSEVLVFGEQDSLLGERTLQELMKRRGGFAGNAQTLLLLCETIYQNESGVKGMQPTRALLDGVLKYKKLYTEFPAPPLNHFIYDSQGPVRDWVFAGNP